MLFFPSQVWRCRDGDAGDGDTGARDVHVRGALQLQPLHVREGRDGRGDRHGPGRVHVRPRVHVREVRGIDA